MIAFVGDLSIADARLLAVLASQSRRILEFGVGGSTQIFAQSNPDVLVSFDTDKAWIERTRANLSRITGDYVEPEFRLYGETIDGQYDLIFVDGIPDKRLEFAQAAWPLLAIDGQMVFHDTRRFEYFREAAWVIQTRFSEVRGVSVNPEASNLTIIQKGERLEYENWNHTEGKPSWAYGKGEIPEGEGLWPIG